MSTLKSLIAAFLLAVLPCSAIAQPAGTTFTYQGELRQGGSPATGPLDLRFRLFDAQSGGAMVGAEQLLAAVPLTDGRFSVELDFGAGAFNGNQRWLEIAVGVNTLSPRQPVYGTPLAFHALTVSTVPSASIGGTYANQLTLSNPANILVGSGSGITALNAANLSSGTIPSARLSGAYTGALTLSNTSNILAGNGAAITALSASNLSTGTIANARTTGTAANTPSTLVLRNASGAFSAGDISATSFAGSGAAITGINASNITAGTLPEARLSADLLSRIPPSKTALSYLGSTGNTGQGPSAIAMDGDRAFVGTSQGNLIRIDLSDPANPAGNASATAGADIRAVVIANGHAWTVNRAVNSVQAFNTESLFLNGGFLTGALPQAAAASGNFLFVVTGGASMLEAFNIANPSAPTAAGSVPTGNNPQGVAISGNHAFVVSSTGLQVFNIASPASMTLVGSAPTAANPLSIAVVGGRAYIPCHGADTLQVFDISNPAAPALLGSTPTDSGPINLAVSGDVTYIVTINAQTLQAFDTGNPADIALIETLSTPTFPRAVGVGPGYIAVPCIVGASVETIATGGVDFGIAELHANAFAGSGLALTDLNASSISAGSLAAQHLPTGGSWPLATNLNIDANTLVIDRTNNRVGIGTASPGFQLQLSQNSAAKPTSNTWTIASDARLKKNVRTIDRALDHLLGLRGVSYQWINPAAQGNMAGTYTGFIAQEVERIFPEWITTGPDGYKRLTVIGFEGLTVEALRQLRAEKDAQIQQLRTENQAQAGQISSQQRQIDRLQEELAQLRSAVRQLQSAQR